MSVTKENSKLQDAVLSVAKKNAKYAEMVEDLVGNVADQERKIWIWRKNGKYMTLFIPRGKANKISDEQNDEKDHAFVEAMYP